jgi:hypothetical protein
MIWLSLGVNIGLIWYVTWLRKRLKQSREANQLLIVEHTNAFAALISTINHEGQVPIASTALGLTNLISLALTKCISLLLELLERKDWNTSLVIEELQQIKGCEIPMVRSKVAELLLTIRKVLEEFDHRQNGNVHH